MRCDEKFRLWAAGMASGLFALLLGGACAHQDSAGGVWVHDLDIRGNDTFSDRTLRKKLATVQTGWWPLASKKWFDAAALDIDLKRIPAFYADHGYFDARVVRHEVKERKDRQGKKTESVDVVIVVEEGKPTAIESVTLDGFPPGPTDERVRSLARSWGLRPGERVSYEDWSALKAKVEDRLKEDGYAYAKIAGTMSVDRDGRVAALAITAEPGPAVRLGETSIVGNGDIPARKLLNRVTWDAGDPYDPGDLATTQGRLYDLGVFSSVTVELPTEPTDRADVRINVTPGKLRELRLGGGAGAERQRQEVRLRADWTFSNFLGGLRKLRLRAKPAYVTIPAVTDVVRQGLAAETSAELTQPDIFGSNASLRALAGYDLMLTQGYEAHGPRAQLGVDRPFLRDRMVAGVAWNLQFLDFFDVNTDVFDPATTTLGFGFKNPYRLAFLEQFVQLDMRDRPTPS